MYAKTRRQLLLYYTIGLAKLDPTQSPYVKVLLAREMQKGLVNRPAADHDRIKADFPTIFAAEPSEEELREAEKNYKPAP